MLVYIYAHKICNTVLGTQNTLNKYFLLIYAVLVLISNKLQTETIKMKIKNKKLKMCNLLKAQEPLIVSDGSH